MKWLKKLSGEGKADKEKKKEQTHKRSDSFDYHAEFEKQQEEWVIAYAIATSKSEFDSRNQQSAVPRPSDRSLAATPSYSLDFDDVVADDVSRDFPEVADKGEFPSREVIPVDPSKDSALNTLMARSADAYTRSGGPQGRMEQPSADMPEVEEKLEYAMQLFIRRDVKPQTDQKQNQKPAFVVARQDIVVPEDSLRNAIAGGYGTVLKAERDGRAVALKIYNYQTAAASLSLKEREAAVMEACILQLASHHNIVRCFGVVYDPSGVPSLQGSLVMEWVNGGNLFQWLHRNKAASLHQRVSLAAQVAAGMKHIHGQKIRHGDLKPENVLVREVDGEQEAKICDFGLAVYNTTLGTRKIHSFSGTVAYLSPERLGAQSSGPSYQDDVYAFGIVMHVILTSSRPYPLEQHPGVTLLNVQAGKLRPDIDAALSNCQPSDKSSVGVYIDLARRCWHQTAEERPGFPEIYRSLLTILDQITSS